MEFAERVAPELREGLAYRDAIGLGDFQELHGDAITKLRERLDQMMSARRESIVPNDRVVSRDVTIMNEDGGFDVRIYRPAAIDDVVPALIWFHGGGMMFGGLDLVEPMSQRYCEDLGCVVVSVDYRLAPENPYPAGHDDCYAALVWVAENAEKLGIDAARIAVGGESAGAGLTATAAVRARDTGGPSIAFQVLLYPMLDDRSTSPSMVEFNDISVWSGQHNYWAWRALLGDRAGTDAVDCYAAAARTSDLAGLPPAIVQVGELDVLRDEAIDYAGRLMRAGVPTDLHVYSRAYHAWDVSAPRAPQAIRAYDERIEALRRALAGPM